MQMAAGRAAWLCSLNQRFLWHLSRPGCTPSPWGLPLISPGCCLCRALFNQLNMISCFHSSCLRDLLMLHLRSGGQHSFPRWGGGWGLWCSPHFPSMGNSQLGASGVRSKGLPWDEEQDSQDRSKWSKCKQNCRGRCLFSAPAFYKW